MRIDEITLSNFRAFGSLTIRLDPQLTVISGRNRAGKTTVLEEQLAHSVYRPGTFGL